MGSMWLVKRLRLSKEIVAVMDLDTDRYARDRLETLATAEQRND